MRLIATLQYGGIPNYLPFLGQAAESDDDSVADPFGDSSDGDEFGY